MFINAKKFYIVFTMNQAAMKEELTSIAFFYGGRLFGCYSMGEEREAFHFEIKAVSEKLPYAISIGVPVSPMVLKTIADRPNYIYKAHYQQINHSLNDIAFRISGQIQEYGYKALPVPASQLIKWKPMEAHLSHRIIAHKAGLGWWGKNNLLVNEKYGSKVRLVTVLTDLELPPDRPVESDCGDCVACIKACPAGAIGENREDFDLTACYEQVAIFARPDNIGTYICGLCLKVCNGNNKKGK